MRNVDSSRRPPGFDCCALAMQQRVLQHIPPDSGHVRCTSLGLLWAKSGHQVLIICKTDIPMPTANKAMAIAKAISQRRICGSMFCPSEKARKAEGGTLSNCAHHVCGRNPTQSR